MNTYTRIPSLWLACLLAASASPALALEVIVSEFRNGEPIPPGYVDVADGVPEGAALLISEPPFVDYIIPTATGSMTTPTIIAQKENGPYLSNPADPGVFLQTGSTTGANRLVNPDRWHVSFTWDDGVPLPFAADFFGVSWANWSSTQFARMQTRVDLPDDQRVRVWHWFNDGWDYVVAGHTVFPDGHRLTVTHHNAAGAVVGEQVFNLMSGKATQFFGDHRMFYTVEVFVQRQAAGDYVLITNEAGNIGYKGTVVELLGGEPPPPTWAGYPLVDGWGDTGDFLGWVFPLGDFVYGWDLGRYLYLPADNVSASGAWVYFYK